MRMGRRWSLGATSVGKSGTKQFGTALWGNSCRLGWQLNFWRWEIQLMRERRR